MTKSYNLNESDAAQVLDFINKLEYKVGLIRNRIEYRTKNKFSPNLLKTEVNEGVLWLTFGTDEVTQELTIPIPQKNAQGNTIVECGKVQRAVGSWMINNKEITYWELVLWALTERVEEYFPTSSKRIYLERLLRSFEYESSPMVFRNFQHLLDELVNQLPLIGTPMQCWAMCNRIQVIDPAWKKFTPKEALAYQKEMNLRFFPWTSLGQSDSGMCNNTLLKVDVRKTVPFGLAHHNPRRNLFQTLVMKGDEPPKVMSTTERKLSEQGIVRKGWVWNTAFVDMPDNFEDQIIVSERLADLFVTEKRSFTCFGTILAEAGDEVHFLYPLSIEPDGSVVRFNAHSDHAVISNIEDNKINFNGSKTDVKVVTVEYKRLFKDGFKITNRHGNKGIICLKDTGTMHDPIRGEVPIDVIVSAKSVTKRKNFGQLFEALTTLLHGPEKELTLKDGVVAHLNNVKNALVRKGYRKDGTSKISTQWGEFEGVCGWVHWGCVKTPEDQVWTKYDTRTTNSKDVRTAGNKISHIEMRSLITIFGKDNPVIKEIMEHWQGHEQTFGLIKVLETMQGIEPKLPVVGWETIPPVNQTEGFFHDLAELSGTVADGDKFPGGFYVKLPEEYRYVIIKVDNNTFSEQFLLKEEVVHSANTVVLDKIMVPAGDLRKPWKHQSGKYGLSDVAALANTIINAIYKYKSGDGKAEHIGRAIYLYFHGLSSSISTKKGLLSNYCMSVRYPWSVKGTAAVGVGLAPNEIEIHENMAKDLKVGDGDFVIVERFPCLGFMSMRVQKVVTTRDPNAKYVIRVSGNSLASQALDFDGDVIYLMSFHTPQAREAMEKEFLYPHPIRAAAYKEASDKKEPCFTEMDIDDYNIEIFPTITSEQNADIVEGLTGLKRGTGTIIALCYNLMRILERSIGYNDEGTSAALEILLDKVANSVFSLKHAGRSLEAECREAICTADVEQMINLGFNPEASTLLSETIRSRAKDVGFNPNSLKAYFEKTEARGGSSIVNIIVRKFHKVWFTSRSNLHPINLLENLNVNPEDLSGWLVTYSKDKCKDKCKEQNVSITPTVPNSAGSS